MQHDTHIPVFLLHKLFVGVIKLKAISPLRGYPLRTCRYRLRGTKHKLNHL